ncbi:hypothetical protein QQX13_01975 [Demequina sp. SYSU T00068]|uniref:hypothetical protein n=1 Tax=Demequina lignilytica TaxID=3051663 RepID=UPI00263901E0|nr:hypothetical protein [Demequina sp. SYSU T00068]MDN4489592.1 hypothetical protein [Demequina sp. SYSU T00068]
MTSAAHDPAKAIAGMCDCADCTAARASGGTEHAVQRYERLAGALSERRLDQEIVKEPRIRRLSSAVAIGSIGLVVLMVAAGIWATQA